MAQRLRPDLEFRRAGPRLSSQLSGPSALLVTARKVLTGHLPVSARLLRLIVDSLAEGVVVANMEGRFVLFNPAAERILSLGFMDVPLSEWSSVYGTYMPDMVSPLPAEELPLAKSLRGESVDDCEIFIRRNGGPSERLDQRQQPADRRLQWPDCGRCGDVPRHHVHEEPTRAPSTPLEDRRGHGRRRPGHRQHGEHRVRQRRVRRDDRIHAVRGAGQEPQTPQVRPPCRELLRGSLGELLRGEVFRDTITDRRKNGELYLSSQTITPLKSPDGTISHLVSIANDVTERRKAMDLENGLRLARQVQQRLFPPAPPNVSGLDAWGVSIPAHATGGDYFDS